MESWLVRDFYYTSQRNMFGRGYAPMHDMIEDDITFILTNYFYFNA